MYNRCAVNFCQGRVSSFFASGYAIVSVSFVEKAIFKLRTTITSLSKIF